MDNPEGGHHERGSHFKHGCTLSKRVLNYDSNHTVTSRAELTQGATNS